MLSTNLNYQAHPTSDIQTTDIGNGTTIWQFCVILSEARIGKNCNINALVLIENNVVIGDQVTIKSGVQVWNGVRIEDNVFVGPNVTFTNDLSPRSKKKPDEFLKIVVEHGASLGANATIIGGVSIGPYAMVGAGSVVTRDIGRQELWYGNPAKHKGYVCKCGNKTDSNLVCTDCFHSEN
jgi:UDP-2-acetamido-3-amino-2,3-dideoxy-glucuronate N-acetyltransferase